MAVDLLPSELVRVISAHERVRLRVGERDPTYTTAAVAAFEDTLFLFLAPDSSAVERMLSDPRCRVDLEGPEGLRVHLVGRCVAGQPVMSHRRRMELLPWVPEDQDPRRVLAVPFWTSEVDYQRPLEGERFQGETPAAKVPSLVRRLGETTLGSVWPLTMLGMAIYAFYVALLGPEMMMLRPLALALGLGAVVLAQFSVMCAFRAAAFSGWRAGTVDQEHAPMQVQGLLAPKLLWQLAVVSAIASLAMVAPTRVWGAHLTGVTLVSTLVWALIPMVSLRLRADPPKPRT